MSTTEILKERLASVKQHYAEIQSEIASIEAQETELAKRKSEFTLEMIRVQGENRLLVDLLKDETVV